MPPNDYKYPFTPPPKPRFSGVSLLSHLSRPYVWLSLGLLVVAIGGLGVYALTKQTPLPSGEPETIASWSGNDESDKTSADVKTDKAEKDKQDAKKSSEESTKTSKKAAAKKKPAKTSTSTGSTGSTGGGGGGSTGGASGGGSTGGSTGGTNGGGSTGSLVKPNSSNTGPRYSITRSLTPSQALSELRRTGYLSRVRITGSLYLSGSDGRNWVIEDSIINGSSRYTLQSYISLTGFTGSMSERAVFRYVEMIGRAATGGSRCSAVVYGRHVVLQNADIYGCDDGVKASTGISIISSWLHDNDHPSGAHCDSLQIRSGTDILVYGSRFDAYVGYSSDGSQTPPSGGPCSGGLQTGSVTGTISARFENNWFAGGGYTIRGWASRDAGYSMSYVFRNNKWMRYGTSVALGRTNLTANRYGPTTGSLGDFDDSNVWEDTGQPVR